MGDYEEYVMPIKNEVQDKLTRDVITVSFLDATARAMMEVRSAKIPNATLLILPTYDTVVSAPGVRAVANSVFTDLRIDDLLLDHMIWPCRSWQEMQTVHACIASFLGFRTSTFS